MQIGPNVTSNCEGTTLLAIDVFIAMLTYHIYLVLYTIGLVPYTVVPIVIPMPGTLPDHYAMYCCI